MRRWLVALFAFALVVSVGWLAPDLAEARVPGALPCVSAVVDAPEPAPASDGLNAAQDLQDLQNAPDVPHDLPEVIFTPPIARADAPPAGRPQPLALLQPLQPTLATPQRPPRA